MDFENYKNRLEYPSRLKIRSAILSELDDVPMTKTQRIEAERNAHATADAKVKMLISAYGAEDGRLRDLFFADAHDEISISYLPKPILDKLDSMAWDRGHSAGYHEVYNAMCDLAELAHVAYEAGKQDGGN